MLTILNLYVLLTLVNPWVLSIFFDLCPINFSAFVHPVGALKPACSANSNKIVCTVNSNKMYVLLILVNWHVLFNSSKFVRNVDLCTVNSNNLLHHVNSGKPVRLVDVHKPTLSVNSNKIVRIVLINV